MQTIGNIGIKEKILIGLIRFYRAVRKSGIVPWSCRFQPSCSTYAIESIGRYGAIHGSRLTLQRLFRCHPAHPGGWDPVP